MSGRQITVEEALGRLRTFTTEPDEETRSAVIEAARAFVREPECESPTEGLDAYVQLRKAVQTYEGQVREMVGTVAAYGMGMGIDAETARDDLRRAIEIRETASAMARVRGCHIEAKINRLGGGWLAYGSEPTPVEIVEERPGRHLVYLRGEYVGTAHAIDTAWRLVGKCATERGQSMPEHLPEEHAALWREGAESVQ